MRKSLGKRIPSFRSAEDGLALGDGQLDEERLRRESGHDLEALLDEAIKHESTFTQMKPYISRIDSPPSARYQADRRPATEALEVMALAHSLCELVAQALLHSIAKRRNGFFPLVYCVRFLRADSVASLSRWRLSTRRAGPTTWYFKLSEVPGGQPASFCALAYCVERQPFSRRTAKRSGPGNGLT
jgi:hypothetical protein